MSRREFTKAVRVEIIKRATRQLLNGSQQYCEECGAQATGRFEIDHRDPDGLQIDKSKALTAGEGWLLCVPCHREKTAKDVADIARAKRREAAHLGATPPSDHPVQNRQKKDKPPLRVASGVPGIMRRFRAVNEKRTAQND